MVPTFLDTEGHGDDTVCSRDTVQAADEVREVVQHTQIMFYNYYISTWEGGRGFRGLTSRPSMCTIQSQYYWITSSISSK